MNWDIYFLKLAKQVAVNSKCYSRQIGAVIVKNKRVVSTGYNGPAVGVRRCDEWIKEEGWPITHSEPSCPRRAMGFKSGEGIHVCPAGHAERNSLISCALNGISTLGATLYCYCGIPCKECMIEIINAGITQVVCTDDSIYDSYAAVYAKDAKLPITIIKRSEVDAV